MNNETMSANAGGLVYDMASEYAQTIAQKTSEEAIRKYYEDSILEDILQNWTENELMQEYKILLEEEESETNNN